MSHYSHLNVDTGITANQSAITWQIEIVSTYPSLQVTLVLGKLIAASYCHLLPHSALKGYNKMNKIKYKNKGKGTPRQDSDEK